MGARTSLQIRRRNPAASNWRSRASSPRARAVVEIDDGTKIISRVSICATGVEYRRLNLANEDKLLALAFITERARARLSSAAMSTW
jgi:hypothetical protein